MLPLIGVGAAACTLALTRLSMLVSWRIGALARPDARRLHSGAIPCAGAAAVIVASAGALTVGIRVGAFICAGALVIVALGVWDDRGELAVRAKLLGQLAAAALAVIGSGIGPDLISAGPLVVHLGPWADPIWIAGLVVVMNTVNLIDGHDALAAGLCVIAGATIAVLCVLDGRGADGALAASTAGAALGFLWFNRPGAARAFLGDQGSLGLGYLLGAAALIGAAKTGAALGLAGAMLALAIPAGDALRVALGRVMRGAPPWEADRTHLHHRLRERGWGMWGVPLRIWAAACAWSAYALLMHTGYPRPAWQLVAGALACVLLTLLLLRMRAPRTRDARGPGEQQEPPVAPISLPR